MPVRKDDIFIDAAESELATRLKYLGRRLVELADYCHERAGESTAERHHLAWCSEERKCLVNAAMVAQAELAPAQLDQVEKEFKRIEARIADVRSGHRETPPPPAGSAAPTWKRN